MDSGWTSGDEEAQQQQPAEESAEERERREQQRQLAESEAEDEDQQLQQQQQQPYEVEYQQQQQQVQQEEQSSQRTTTHNGHIRIQVEDEADSSIPAAPPIPENFFDIIIRIEGVVHIQHRKNSDDSERDDSAWSTVFASLQGDEIYFKELEHNNTEERSVMPTTPTAPKRPFDALSRDLDDKEKDSFDDQNEIRQHMEESFWSDHTRIVKSAMNVEENTTKSDESLDSSPIKKQLSMRRSGSEYTLGTPKNAKIVLNVNLLKTSKSVQHLDDVNSSHSINVKGAKVAQSETGELFIHLENGAVVCLQADDHDASENWMKHIMAASADERPVIRRIDAQDNPEQRGTTMTRRSHCIPHRFCTENFLLRLAKCKVCQKTIREFRGARCIHCNSCYHQKCSVEAPPNCGLARIKKALETVERAAPQEKVRSKGKAKGDKADLTGVSAEIFGVEIGQLPIDGDGIPLIARMCVTSIDRRGLESEGIYRLSGKKSDVQKLRVHFSFGRPNLDDENQWNDVNVIAGVFKAWLRELPTPLFTYDLFSLFCDIGRSDPFDVDAAQGAIELLPLQNQILCRYLFLHLARVAEKGDVNKMRPTNLGAIFGPTVLRPHDESFGQLQAQISLVEQLIVHANEIFV